MPVGRTGSDAGSHRSRHVLPARMAQESHSDVVNHVEALRGIPLQRTSIAIPWPANHCALRNIADRVAGHHFVERLVLARLRPFSPMLNPAVRLVELAEVGGG